MGGRPSTKPSRIPVSGGASPADGGGTGPGGGVQPGDSCPAKLVASIAGPVQGIAASSWLDVVLKGASVVFVDPVSGQTVGALMGVPNLAVLIQCLSDGVVYRAFVANVSGGRIDVTIIRQ